MVSLKCLFAGIILFLTSPFVHAQDIGKKIKIDPYHYSIQKDVEGKNGMVVCAHTLAAKVGLDILMQGGNAVDAAIAVQLALAVVYPGAGNLGGGGFMVARFGDGKRIALDFREVAPAGATEDMYVDKKTGMAIEDLSLSGHLACGVPGTVAGLFAAMKYAKLPFENLIRPAIELADKGFVINEREANALNNTAGEFRKNNPSLPVFVRQGGWKAGDTLVQKELARTLTRIQRDGAKGFYEGETAKLIVDEMKNSGGIISFADLKNYKVEERVPDEFDYRGYHIITMPLPGSGGVLLHQMLRMLEARPVSSYGFHTAKSVQLITEVERRAYADRSEYLGDPDFIKVPVKTLVSDTYLKARMADYDSTHASTTAAIKPGYIKESDQTTHLSIIDKDGNCVSVTTTLNGTYGSKCVVAGAGFILNNEMDDFSVQQGVPNQYGAIGGKANAIAPNKRMLSSMSPTIVLKDNRPFMVVGTPGGTTIITSVLQSIINVVDFGMNAHDAVNEPKFHHQWLPDQVDVEKDFPADVCRQLHDMGYKINERKPWSRTELIKLKDGTLYEAAADKRGDDDAEGY